MFARRHPRTLLQKCKEALWPSMGMRRAFRYWRHRIVRLKDSNYKIAAGLAFGAAISFTPIPGAHVLGAVALCFIFRANLMAGALGTLFGNPWTLPVLWWFSYWVGKITFNDLGFRVRRMPEHFEWKGLVHEITHDPMRLFAPWVTGGFIVMILSWPLFYFIFHKILQHLHATKHLWKKTRLRKEARIITGQSR